VVFLTVCMFALVGIFVGAWYGSYVVERRVCMIYDIGFRDDIVFKRYRSNDWMIQEQGDISNEFESLKVVGRNGGGGESLWD
jgi:hypothetical protein